MKNIVKEQLGSGIEVINKIINDDLILDSIVKVVDACIFAYRNNKKILICGNGGSAADAQHFVGELVSRFYFDRPGLSAISLTTNTTLLTAIGNDYGFERVFARQVEALGENGDVLIGISTSGNSLNVVEALKVGKTKELICVSLTGEESGKMYEYSDYVINVPSKITPRIQEAQLAVEHIICFLIEDILYGRKGND